MPFPRFQVSIVLLNFYLATSISFAASMCPMVFSKFA